MIKQNKLQKLNLQNLLDVSKILQNVEHFVFYGTLLGLIREQKIIRGDDDVDFITNLKNKKIVQKKCELINLLRLIKKFPINTLLNLLKKKITL